MSHAAPRPARWLTAPNSNSLVETRHTGGIEMTATRMVPPAMPAGIVLAAGFTAPRAQDAYPNKPIHLIVPFAAGGPTDIVGRIMATKMGGLLGQQFVVENRAGAGGNIGADFVSKASADGYTLLVATVSTHAINPGLYKQMPYDPIRDFTPISRVGVTPTLLGVNNALPA